MITILNSKEFLENEATESEKTKKIKMLHKKTAEFLRFSFCENLAKK